jgi:BCCT family betaine/carnitine transporter
MNNITAPKTKGKIDWLITLVPLLLIVGMSLLFFFIPEQSNAVIGQIRYFLGDTLGSYYLIIGLGIFLIHF